MLTKQNWGTIAIVGVLALGLGSQAPAEEVCPSLLTGLGVCPVYDPDWTSGNAATECVTNLGFDFGLKIDGKDGWTANGDFTDGSTPGFENTVTISNNDGTYFDWSASPYPLEAVAVKGGPGANVFYYDPAASNDTGLYAPINSNNEKPFGISHASFCWNQSEKCYQEETAWAAGERYTAKGSWAMFVPYAGVEKTVDIVAGQTITDGTATFSAPDANGQVTITIALAPGFIFYYDLNGDDDDHNLKVQDYERAPSGNPQIGKFDHKQAVPVGSTAAVITVPYNNFYGVHLDVARAVDCEE